MSGRDCRFLCRVQRVRSWERRSTDYVSSRIGRDVPAQEATARQALTVTLRHTPINAEPLESSIVSVQEAGTRELFGPELGAQYNRISGRSKVPERGDWRARRMTPRPTVRAARYKVGAVIAIPHYNGAHKKMIAPNWCTPALRRSNFTLKINFLGLDD